MSTAKKDTSRLVNFCGENLISSKSDLVCGFGRGRRVDKNIRTGPSRGIVSIPSTAFFDLIQRSTGSSKKGD
jgi:hypothetical protein